MHGARDARGERVQHQRVEAHHRAALVVVGGGLEVVARASVGVSRRDDQAIHADAVGPGRQGGDPAVQQRGPERKVGDHERQPVAFPIGEHQDPGVQAQAIAARGNPIVAQQIPHTS